MKTEDFGLLLDVAAPDHLIVGDDRYYSFAEKGVI